MRALSHDRSLRTDSAALRRRGSDRVAEPHLSAFPWADTAGRSAAAHRADGVIRKALTSSRWFGEMRASVKKILVVALLLGAIAMRSACGTTKGLSQIV